ncbi:hypothetical protein [Roseomonas sp. USHLN139]|uniref:hypothetical protein n=1 Tax=Roseomonas sp. USHLN139 TaxID=3081298 RepID=UPI003B010FB7
MDDVLMAEAFNLWMQDYTENPAAFEAEFNTVGQFLTDLHAGRMPSYGETQVETLKRYAARAVMNQLAAIP